MRYPLIRYGCRGGRIANLTGGKTVIIAREGEHKIKLPGLRRTTEFGELSYGDSLLKPAAETDHFISLDSIRGLAALLVVIAHAARNYVDIAHPTGMLSNVLIRVPAHQAVVLFFVLSGFVLYLAFERRPDTPYMSYLIRRLFRLYPAFLVSLGVALALQALQHPSAIQGFGHEITFYWVYPIDPVMVLRTILMLDVVEPDRMLNPVMWSLALELRFSMLLIPLSLLATRRPAALLVLALVGYAIARFLMWRLGMNTDSPQIGKTLLGSIALTLFYLPGFCFGILAARLYKAKANFPIVAQITSCGALLLAGKLTHDDTLTGAGFAVFLLLALHPGLLRSALMYCKPLGDISYSLYLIHAPVLMAVIYGFHGIVPDVVTVTVGPIVAIGLATLMYRYVELPGIAAGKMVVSPRPAPVAQKG